MKPAAFDYVAVHTVGEALAALDAPEAHVLAGGQSLVLEMNFRNLRPGRVVDINPVAEFDALDHANGALHVGPLVRHRTFEEPVDDGPLGRLLQAVAHHIAHPPIRARGTMVGSLAYAHPAAEWPAVAVALGAELELADAGGRRTISAEDFFLGPFRTARRPGELVFGVRLPTLDPGTGVGFVEHRRTAASFADLAALATLRLRDGQVERVRVGLVNSANRPVRAHEAERVLVGTAPSAHALTAAGHAAAEDDADPREQPYAGVAYQRHAVAVLVRRALEIAVQDASPEGW